MLPDRREYQVNQDRLQNLQEQVSRINENLRGVNLYNRFTSLEQAVSQVSQDLATQIRVHNEPPGILNHEDLSIASGISSTSGLSGRSPLATVAATNKPNRSQAPTPVSPTFQMGRAFDHNLYNTSQEHPTHSSSTAPHHGPSMQSVQHENQVHQGGLPHTAYMYTINHQLASTNTISIVRYCTTKPNSTNQ